MAKRIFWINFWCVMLYFMTPGIAGDHEHIHIKLHLPEVIKKHTHLRTVVKHHFHPKKINKIHHHHIDEALSTDLEPSIAFAPPFFSGHGGHGGHYSSWKPKPKIVDMKLRKPSSLSLIHPSSSAHSWKWENDFPKIFKSHKYQRSKFNGFPNHLPNYEFLNDIKFHHNFNKFEDDEDEFVMSEDTSLEQPHALKLKNPFDTYSTLPNHWGSGTAVAADSLDTANGFESANSDGVWPNLSPLSPPLDQTAYAATIQNNYGIDEGQHAAATAATAAEFERFPTSSTKSKFKFEPGMENFLEYNYSRRPPKQWKKMKRNKSQRGNRTNFRIRL